MYIVKLRSYATITGARRAHAPYWFGHLFVPYHDIESTLERLEFFVDGAVYEYVNPIDSSQLTHELQGFFAYPIIANGMP